jgi:hypothetical protein
MTRRVSQRHAIPWLLGPGAVALARQIYELEFASARLTEDAVPIEDGAR